MQMCVFELGTEGPLVLINVTFGTGRMSDKYFPIPTRDLGRGFMIQTP